MDKVVYVVSDLHLGPGWLPNGQMDPLEDFSADQEFARFLDTIGTRGDPVELVLAGDLLEYCQTLPEIGLASPEDHLGSTEAESLQRTRVILGLTPSIASGHSEVFQALRRFMVAGNSITIIAGNHDIDLLWDGVWALVFDTIYPPGAWGDLRLVPYSYTLGNGTQGRVYIEHGHEHDPPNRFGDQMSQPFGLDKHGNRRLKRCWGTLFVDKVFNQLERDRWFIDNVKPIMRVVQLGLRNDLRFTATALALVVRFLLTSGLPPLLGGASTEASEPHLAQDPTLVATAIADPALLAAVLTHLEHRDTRAEFERVLRGADPDALNAVLRGNAPPISFANSPEGVGDELLLGGGKAAEDAYKTAAREVLEADASLRTVIMGHTHSPIDGYAAPVDLMDGRQGFYFNSGTWTRHLRDEGRRTYSWDEITDAANYTTLLSYIRLDPDGTGGYRPALASWYEEGA